MTMFFPALPTSNSGVLPAVLNSLDNQLKAMSATDATKKQYAIAVLTATVATSLFGAVDAAWHTLNCAVKAPFALVSAAADKAGFTSITSKMSPALSGAEWVAHAKKIFISAGMVFSAYWGLSHSSLVVQIGRNVGLMDVPAAPVAAKRAA